MLPRAGRSRPPATTRPAVRSARRRPPPPASRTPSTGSWWRCRMPSGSRHGATRARPSSQDHATSASSGSMPISGSSGACAKQTMRQAPFHGGRLVGIVQQDEATGAVRRSRRPRRRERTSPASASAFGASPLRRGDLAHRRGLRGSGCPAPPAPRCAKAPMPPGDAAQPRGQTRVSASMVASRRAACAPHPLLSSPACRPRSPCCSVALAGALGALAVGSVLMARRGRHSGTSSGRHADPRARHRGADDHAVAHPRHRAARPVRPVHDAAPPTTSSSARCSSEDATSVKRKLLTHVAADARARARGGVQRLVLRPSRAAAPAVHPRADRLHGRPVPGMALPRRATATPG